MPMRGRRRLQSRPLDGSCRQHRTIRKQIDLPISSECSEPRYPISRALQNEGNSSAKRGGHGGQPCDLEKIIFHGAETPTESVARSLPPLWGRARVGCFEGQASKSGGRPLQTVPGNPPP
jgi:hypothetical protein